MKKVSLILLTYNNFKLTSMRLREIFTYLNSSLYDLELILVDNGSFDDSMEKIYQIYEHPLGDHVVIRLENNQGFGGGFNVGLKRATGDILICLSNDVVVYGNFIEKMLPYFLEKSRVLLGGKIIDFAGGWNEFGDKFVPYVEGWMVATTKENWKELDYWDERFYPSDCEDIDLSMKAIQKGYGFVSLSAHFPRLLHHIGSGTINDGGRMDRTKINRKKLLDKWEGNIDFLV